MDNYNTEDLYNRLQKQKNDLDKLKNLLNQVEDMRESVQQKKDKQNSTTSITFEDKPIAEQLKMLRAFMFSTRCEVLSAINQLKTLEDRISFLESYLNKQFHTYETRINDIVNFCNGLTIIGYEDEDGNIIDCSEEDDSNEDL